MKLQNYFTTPGQSKRLLELGLPKESADCFLDAWEDLVYRDERYKDSNFFETHRECVPCWSVGRLMEIHDIFIEDRDTQFGWAMMGDYNYINYIISRFEDENINFGKL